MKAQWFLVANASLARLFRRDSPTDPLVPLATMEHPESRLKQASWPTTAPATKPPTTAAEATASSRAATCAARSTSGSRAKSRGDWIWAGRRRVNAPWLFASSPFLGELKAQLSDAVSKRVQLALDSDLTALGLTDIEQRLRDPRLGM